MFNFFCLVLTAAMLFFIVRYRVHITIRIETPQKARSARPKRATAPAPPTDNTAAILTETLMNLGATRKQASAAALRAVAGPPAPFETLLQRALKEAA